MFFQSNTINLIKPLFLPAIISIFIHIFIIYSTSFFLNKKQIKKEFSNKSIMVTMSYKQLEKKIIDKPFQKTKPQKTKPMFKNKKQIKPIIPNLEPAKQKKIKKTLQTNIFKPVNKKKRISKKLNNSNALSTIVNTTKHKNKTPSKNENITNALPLYKANPKPEYPKKARKRGYQGIVELMVNVSKKGEVLNLWIYKSSQYSLLDKKAVDTVRNWRFEPARSNGTPVDIWVKIPIKFELK